MTRKTSSVSDIRKTIYFALFENFKDSFQNFQEPSENFYEFFMTEVQDELVFFLGTFMSHAILHSSIR